MIHKIIVVVISNVKLCHLRILMVQKTGMIKLKNSFQKTRMFPYNFNKTPTNFLKFITNGNE